MELIGKLFVQRFKRHGVRSEIYHLSSNSSSSSTTSEQETVAAPEGFESIARPFLLAMIWRFGSCYNSIETRLTQMKSIQI